MTSRTAKGPLETEREAVAQYCQTHRDPRFRAAREYVKSNQSTFVAVPGRGMVNLMDFSPADEAAFAALPLDELMKYCQEFKARVNKQSRRLRELRAMTSKVTVAVPGGQYLRLMTQLSEDDLQAIEKAGDAELRREYARQVGGGVIQKPKLTSSVPSPARRSDRALPLYTPPPGDIRRREVTTLV